MAACKLICYFSSHPVGFGFQASSEPDNIIPNPVNRKADLESCRYFGAAVHAMLDTEQLISHTRAVIVDTVASYRVLMEELLQLQTCMKCELGFITFLTMLCQNGLII